MKQAELNITKLIESIKNLSTDGIAPSIKEYDQNRPKDCPSFSAYMGQGVIDSWCIAVQMAGVEMKRAPSRPNVNLNGSKVQCDCGQDATHFPEITILRNTLQILPLCDSCKIEFDEMESEPIYALTPLYPQ